MRVETITCDRCGKKINQSICQIVDYPVLEIYTKTHSDFPERKIDLCLACKNYMYQHIKKLLGNYKEVNE